MRITVLTAESVGAPYNLPVLEGLADVTVTDAAGLAVALPGSDALLLWDFFSPALREAWPVADALAWIHVAAAGIDSLLFEELRASEVQVTNARGVFDQPIAEYVAAAVLAHDKRLHESERLQRAHAWRHREVTRTAGSRAVVVGTGGIGRACARTLRALGVDVTGAGRRAIEDDPDFGRVVPAADLVRHLGAADHVVLAAPLTDATRGMVGAAELAALRPSAHLVNVGRGALVDEPALVEALLRDELAAATLDVFAQEPLPEGHPFWDLDQVHVSAHMCGDVTGWRAALADQFEENLRRFLAGRPLMGVVDKAAGYVRDGAR